MFAGLGVAVVDLLGRLDECGHFSGGGGGGGTVLFLS